jgi:Rps23 Pro-64 3,4-dihydroxylase Tpa1-like proline 4-hydroxylase
MLEFSFRGLEDSVKVYFTSELLRYKTQFQDTGMVIISDLLDLASAHSIWKYYFNQPTDFWDLALFPDDFNDYGGDYKCYRAKEGDPQINILEPYIRNLNSKGEFSYIYNRTDITYTPLEIFRSQKFIDILGYITGYKGLKFDPLWTLVSCYQEGHYNGPHIDGINGRVAFIYHLSKDWRPGFGGLFLELTEDQKDTKKVVMPDFNKLVLLNVKGDAKGIPHLVTEVSKGCENKRLAYTGWYQ